MRLYAQKFRWQFLLASLALAGFGVGAKTKLAAQPPYCEYDYCDTFLIDECKHNQDLAANCQQLAPGGCVHTAC